MIVRGGGVAYIYIGRPRSPSSALLAFRCGRFFRPGAAVARAPRSLCKKFPIMLCTPSQKNNTTILWKKNNNPLGKIGIQSAWGGSAPAAGGRSAAVRPHLHAHAHAHRGARRHPARPRPPLRSHRLATWDGGRSSGTANVVRWWAIELPETG